MKEEIKKEETIFEEPIKAPETPPSQSELLKTLSEEIQLLKQQNEMLVQVADKKALGNYYARHQKQLPKIIRLNLINEKVITSWKMVKNEVYKDSITLRWIEKQDVSLTLEDGSSLEIPYTDYIRLYIQVEAKVISTITDEASGKLRLKVGRLDNGKEYEIGVEFIN